MAGNAEDIVALFESSGALEMSVFQAFDDGNGTNPLRLATLPRLMPPQLRPLPAAVTAMVADEVFVVSCVETAVTVTLPVLEVGVNVTAVPEATAELALSEPPDDGLRERLTVFV